MIFVSVSMDSCYPFFILNSNSGQVSDFDANFYLNEKEYEKLVELQKKMSELQLQLKTYYDIHHVDKVNEFPNQDLVDFEE